MEDPKGPLLRGCMFENCSVGLKIQYDTLMNWLRNNCNWYHKFSCSNAYRTVKVKLR